MRFFRCMVGVVTDDDRGWQDKGAHLQCRNSEDLARDRAEILQCGMSSFRRKGKRTHIRNAMWIKES
jgi:hypothetical protein